MNNPLFTTFLTTDRTPLRKRVHCAPFVISNPRMTRTTRCHQSSNNHPFCWASFAVGFTVVIRVFPERIFTCLPFQACKWVRALYYQSANADVYQRQNWRWCIQNYFLGYCGCNCERQSLQPTCSGICHFQHNYLPTEKANSGKLKHPGSERISRFFLDLRGLISVGF